MSIKSFSEKIKAYFRNYFDMSTELEDKQAVMEDIRNGVSFKGTNIIILIIAMFIASLGLNVNSAAVIIGAMLISPLMGPIMGMGLGVGIHDYSLIKRSFRNLAMAALFSILASTLYFVLSPLNDERSELLARTSPTIYDVLIAFFGGCAGILGVSSRHKGNVIPGVAIATALMPPLCTAGYGLATLQFSFFLGAFYLFLINSIFIGIATAIGVRVFKFPKIHIDDLRTYKRVSRTVYAISILTIIPSIFLTISMIREQRFITEANAFVDREFSFPNTQVLRRSAEIIDGERVITVSLIGDNLPLDSLKSAMYAKLHDANLGGAKLVINQGYKQGEVDINKLSSQMFRDIYTSNQHKIENQAATIDSLQRLLQHNDDTKALSTKLIHELQVIFPQVEAISLNDEVFALSGDSISYDTINVAIITLRNNLSSEQEKKLTDYLSARTGISDIHLIKTNRF